MANTTTQNVTSNVTLLYGAQGSATSPLQILNLDTVNTIFISNSSLVAVDGSTSVAIGPLASLAFDGSTNLYAVTSPGVTVQVALIPGGTNYSPGSLTINGPVTAEITGPVEVSGTVEIEGTPTVDVAGTVQVEFPDAQEVTITGTADVTVSGTPTFALESGSEIEINNATLDVNATGTGGFILPGEIVNILTNTAALTMGPGSGASRTLTGLQNYSSIDLAVTCTNSSTATGAAYCCELLFFWLDPNSNIVGEDIVFVLCQGSLGGNTSVMSLPVKGSQLQITAFNDANVGTITIGVGDLIVDGSFRTIPGIQFSRGISTISPVTLGGVVWAGAGPIQDTANGWVGQLNQPTNAASTIFGFILNQYVGLSTGNFSVNTTAPPNDPVLIDLSFATVGNIAAGTGTNTVIMAFPATLTTNTQINTFLPAAPCALIVKSATSGNTAIALSLLGMG